MTPSFDANPPHAASVRSTTDAEDVAIRVLRYLASDEQRIERFLALTGLKADQIREAATQPGFFLAILDHICAWEADLTTCAEATGLAPQQISAARHYLERPSNSLD